jgi:hypothetical protein
LRIGVPPLPAKGALPPQAKITKPSEQKGQSQISASGLPANTIRAAPVGPAFAGKQKVQTTMPNQAHTKAAEHHETAAKAHRMAAEHHGKNDHAKGNEHSTYAQSHSKSAREHSEQAHVKSAAKK